MKWWFINRRVKHWPSWWSHPLNSYPWISVWLGREHWMATSNLKNLANPSHLPATASRDLLQTDKNNRTLRLLRLSRYTWGTERERERQIRWMQNINKERPSCRSKEEAFCWKLIGSAHLPDKINTTVKKYEAWHTAFVRYFSASLVQTVRCTMHVLKDTWNPSTRNIVTDVESTEVTH